MRNAFQPYYWLSIVILLSLMGCSAFEKVGSNLTKGASSQSKGLGDSLVRGAAQGLEYALRDSLDPKLNALVSSLVMNLDQQIDSLSRNTQRRVVGIRDSLFNQQLRTYLVGLRNDLIGVETKAQLMSLLDGLQVKLRDEKTRQYLQVLTADLLGTARTQSALLRNDLLGPQTQTAVAAIVDSAMSTLIRRYNNDLSPALNDNIGFIKKNAERLLIGIAILTVLIIAFVWYQRQKYARLLQLITHQIYETPDQQAYDDLTNRIKRNAQEKSLEPTLQEILKTQGIYRNWKPSRINA